MSDERAREIAIALGAIGEVRWAPGYEGLYAVDSSGEVFSVDREIVRVNRGRRQVIRVRGRRLAACLNRNGYPIVRLNAGNAARTFEVHRLVCRAFHGEPAAGMEVAHIDGDKLNKSASNLRWATRRENHADKKRHGTHLYGEHLRKSKLTPAKAVEVCRRAVAGENMYRIAHDFGIDESAVRKIRRGVLWARETVAVRRLLEEGNSQ